MKLLIDTQIRVVSLSNKLEKNKLISKLEADKYIDINDTTLALWDYKGRLLNEKVFNSYLMIDNITVFIDLESRNYLTFRDGKELEQTKIIEEVTKWVRMRYKDENVRLLNSMRSFRSKLLNHKLTHHYYKGIHSDTFSVNYGDKTALIYTWNQKHNKSVLGVDENLSFFIKVCKLVL